MTKKANDKSIFSEFSLWLRKQPEIESSLGYACTNIDYLWRQWRYGKKWMLIEEKRHMAELSKSQKISFSLLHEACKSDPDYRGFHFLQFENTSPEDGKIYWDRKQVTREELINILRFEHEQ